MALSNSPKRAVLYRCFFFSMFVLFVAGCSGSETSQSSGELAVDASGQAADLPTSTPPPPTIAADTSSDTPTPTAVATTAPLTVAPTPTVFARPPAPNAKLAPTVASTVTDLVAQLEQAESILSADPASTGEQLAAAGHLHQVAIRKLGYEPDWDTEFFVTLSADLQARTRLHLAARRALIDLGSGYPAADSIPAWQIMEPEPAADLLTYYRAAEDVTGIEWEYLAAINLIETGMGRIRGLSTAGAQGPMQFLPTTWDEAGIGAGDINDPNDAINAAARYLVRRGGPTDMTSALWGYNNSDNYVAAVQAYAELLRQDPGAYTGIYNWEIYFYTQAGDVWLPSGFRSEESIDLAEYLAANPWSAPDPGLH